MNKSAYCALSDVADETASLEAQMVHLAAIDSDMTY